MITVSERKETINAKPFLKWAGGKTQLIDELVNRIPSHIRESKLVESYVEPFVGGGALFFYLKNHYEIKKALLFDINRELIVGYKVIQNDPLQLIDMLREIEKEYLCKKDFRRKEYYYKIRDRYNKQMSGFNYERYTSSWIERAAYLIFLNKTCYNGLFRQNRNGEFNVPFGRYKNPTICSAENIIEVNKALRDTEILCTDFTETEKYIERMSLVYLDPPYLPLNHTSSFTSYSKENFTEQDQLRLAEFFKKMDKRGAYLILSNSDPKNEGPSNYFFDKLYEKYYIDRVNATRAINCNGNKRGIIKEVIITNYKEGA